MYRGFKFGFGLILGIAFGLIIISILSGFIVDIPLGIEKLKALIL